MSSLMCFILQLFRKRIFSRKKDMVVECNKLVTTPYKSVLDNDNAMYCEIRNNRRMRNYLF